MKAKPISLSLNEELDLEFRQRARQEQMTLSEYFRKCFREEKERAEQRARNVGLQLHAA